MVFRFYFFLKMFNYCAFLFFECFLIWGRNKLILPHTFKLQNSHYLGWDFKFRTRADLILCKERGKLRILIDANNRDYFRSRICSFCCSKWGSIVIEILVTFFGTIFRGFRKWKESLYCTFINVELFRRLQASGMRCCTKYMVGIYTSFFFFHSLCRSQF